MSKKILGYLLIALLLLSIGVFIVHFNVINIALSILAIFAVKRILLK